MKSKPMTLPERLRYAADHGACDPDCHGRCRVCPADAMREAAEQLTEAQANAQVLREQMATLAARWRDHDGPDAIARGYDGNGVTFQVCANELAVLSSSASAKGEKR